jgi:hypothetical protein
LVHLCSFDIIMGKLIGECEYRKYNHE